MSAGSEELDFGVRERLEKLDRRQYWILVAVLALGLALFSFVWRVYWLPEKPIVWRPWSRFRVQQAVSLQQPVLVHVIGSESSPETREVEAVLNQLDQPDFRKTFHVRSGRAFALDPTVSDDQVTWLFDRRPDGPSLWYCPPNGQPRTIPVKDFQWEQWLESWHETTGPGSRPSAEAVTDEP